MIAAAEGRPAHFLELTLEMLAADVAERQRATEPRRRAAVPAAILRAVAA